MRADGRAGGVPGHPGGSELARGHPARKRPSWVATRVKSRGFPSPSAPSSVFLLVLPASALCDSAASLYGRRGLGREVESLAQGGERGFLPRAKGLDCGGVGGARLSGRTQIPPKLGRGLRSPNGATQGVAEPATVG